MEILKEKRRKERKIKDALEILKGEDKIQIKECYWIKVKKEKDKYKNIEN